MAKAQEWLDANYPLGERKTNTNEIEIRKLDLRGSLYLVAFTSLKRFIFHEIKITELILSDCPQLTEIKINHFSQESSRLVSLRLEGCPSLVKLDCSKNIINDLVIQDCPQLTEINCSSNCLKELKFNELPNLKVFNCWSNQLSEINWGIFNYNELTNISISNNDLSVRDLNCFSSFINLEGLWIGTDPKDRIEKRIYNRFFGSLKPLQNLTKLKVLQIEGTDISSGLEHLPESLEKIIYWIDYPYEGFKVKEIEEILADYKDNSEEYYDFSKWRVKNLLLEKEPLVKSLRKQIVDLQERLKNLKGMEEFDEVFQITTGSISEIVNIQGEKNKDPLKWTINQLRTKLEKKKSMSGKRNIIIIGRTGNGKSTLANVLCGNYKFEEHDSMISGTKKNESEIFLVNNIEYKIVDTIGIGDNTGLTENQILEEIKRTTHSLKDGINQILFVTSGRFEKNEIDTFKLLKNIFFDENIVKYITIVRTNSCYFENKDWCKEEMKKIANISNNEVELENLVNSCNELLFVDNPPKDQERRDKSRKILLNHLEDCCEVYNPSNFKELVEINNNDDEKLLSEHIEKKAKEKGLLSLWKQVMGKTMKKLIEIPPKCNIL